MGMYFMDCSTWRVTNKKEFLEMTTIPDPLAMSIGYLVSGYCYLQLIKQLDK